MSLCLSFYKYVPSSPITPLLILAKDLFLVSVPLNLELLRTLTKESGASLDTSRLVLTVLDLNPRQL